MKASVIIVNYKTRDLLADALESLYRLTKGVDFETIVVDNDSRDGTDAMIAERFPSVRYIELDENIGFGRANNRAAELASGDCLFFLNSDTKLLNDAVSVLSLYLDEHPECGACGGNLVGFDGRAMHSFERRFPGPWTDLRRLAELLPPAMRPRARDWNDTGKPTRVAYVTGADMMMRTDLFRELGGFDPGFFMYYEETDLSLRIAKKGFAIVSVPGASIAHLKGASLGSLMNANDHYYRSKYRYMLKNHGRWGMRACHAVFSAICVLKIAAYIGAGKRKGRDVMARNLQAARKAYANCIEIA